MQEKQLRLEAPRWHDFEKERAFRQQYVLEGRLVEV
jgi:hypothetical protein